MADNIEHQDKGELVANCDRLVGVDNIEPLIKIIRGQQVMLDRDLATLYNSKTVTPNVTPSRTFRFSLSHQTSPQVSPQTRKTPFFAPLRSSQNAKTA